MLLVNGRNEKKLMAWLWLIVRLYVGYQRLLVGVEKLTGYDITAGSSLFC